MFRLEIVHESLLFRPVQDELFLSYLWSSLHHCYQCPLDDEMMRSGDIGLSW
jgi:hypothetical protein